MMKVEPELVSNVDVSLFFEKGMTCRIYYIAERYSKANNKYLKSYNPKQESNHMYLDTNDLHVMSNFFPTR